MKLKIQDSVTTNNFSDAQMSEKIMQLYANNGEFLQQLQANQQAFYGVYHSYVSDYRGDYTLSICAETTENNADFDTDANQYQTFVVDTSAGDPVAGVVQTWQKIWQLEAAGELNRAYTFDYEQYLADGTVTIEIAVK